MVAIAALALIAAAGWSALGHGQGFGPLAWFTWSAVTAAAGWVLAWACLVAAGGLIAIRRDALEERGVPYASTRRREALVGPIRAWCFRTFRRNERRDGTPMRRLGLRPGEWVEVRRLDQILQTLDAEGTLDGVPFMPEMAQYCGRRVRVFRRVDKLNDWIHSAGLKRMHDLVLLEELRCDGSAHGGCQANCHLRWRESWLRRTTAGPTATSSDDSEATDASLVALCVRDDETGAPRYVCQATELTTGALPLAWSDPRHYARELWYGNIRVTPFLVGVSLACFNWIQRKRGGTMYPAYVCRAATKTPREDLRLQPGEIVRVKSKRDIEPTLNAASRNRGLYFDRDMLRWCGGKYTVGARLVQVINEKTGKLVHLTSPCIVLQGITATGEYLGFNPEDEHIFWREIWMERAEVFDANSISGN